MYTQGVLLLRQILSRLLRCHYQGFVLNPCHRFESGKLKIWKKRKLKIDNYNDLGLAPNLFVLSISYFGNLLSNLQLIFSFFDL